MKRCFHDKSKSKESSETAIRRERIPVSIHNCTAERKPSTGRERTKFIVMVARAPTSR